MVAGRKGGMGVGLGRESSIGSSEQNKNLSLALAAETHAWMGP